jgi:hypothetical protein
MSRHATIPDGMSVCEHCGAAHAWYWDNDDFLPAADR